MNKKKCLITGASSGLGSFIALKYAQNNFDLVLTYLTHEDEIIKLKNYIENEYNVNVVIVKCDISDESDIDNLKNIVINNYGYVDVLVNNASISKDSTIESKTKDDFMRILEVNLVGTFLISRVFGDMMYKNQKGKIINISSTNGIDTYYEYSLDYDSSKAGVINLTHNLANYYSPYVNVNCVCPGWIDTPMNKDMDIQFRKDEEDKILLKRFANPDEIASLVYFLGSDDASYINDSVIRIDGGKKC